MAGIIPFHIATDIDHIVIIIALLVAHSTPLDPGAIYGGTRIQPQRFPVRTRK